MQVNSVIAKDMEWVCIARTPIWTGDAEQKGDRFIPAGLLGSVRWWFEVLVRGFEGNACDPTADYSAERCPDKKGRRCVVCELFGCTGWARKFRFEVVDCNGYPIQDAIERKDKFVLRFTPLRSIRLEEWALLDLTLRLIAEYGAIGGRTVLKPSDENGREKELHHKDYGLIKILGRPQEITVQENQLRYYVKQSTWRSVNHMDFAWASLDNFWCVHGRHLSRQNWNQSDFNVVLGRNEDKSCVDCRSVHNPRQRCPKTKSHPHRFSDYLINSHGPTDRWIAGNRQKNKNESKKVFSFREPKRTFGFVKPGVIDFHGMKTRLKWKLTPNEFIEGPEIRRILIKSSGGVS